MSHQETATATVLQADSQALSVQSATASNTSPASTDPAKATEAQTQLQQQKQLLVLADVNHFRTTHAYDPSSDTWSNSGFCHEERPGAAATLWNGKMVVAGGRNTANGYLNSVEQWDPEKSGGLWTAFPQMLERRTNLALACFDNEMYAIGGNYQRFDLTSVECYNGETKQWQLVASLNEERSCHCCAVLGIGILAIGGDGLDSCELFDGATKKWKLVASLTTKRWWAAAATLNEKVYVFGGENTMNDNIDLVEEYDSAADKWTLLPVHLSEPRNKLAAAAVGDRIYICGGREGPDVFDSFDASSMQITRLSPLQKDYIGAVAVCVPVSDKAFRLIFDIYD